MLLKELIESLQQLYTSYDAEYIATVGEPRIVVGQSDKLFVDKIEENVYQIHGLTGEI